MMAAAMEPVLKVASVPPFLTKLSLQGLERRQLDELLREYRITVDAMPESSVQSARFRVVPVDVPPEVRSLELARAEDAALSLASTGDLVCRALRKGGAAHRTVAGLFAIAMSRCMAAEGIAKIHAAAFKLGGSMIMACGPHGSGKSTLSVAASAAGAKVISDDSVLYGEADGRDALVGFRRRLSLRAGSLGLIPQELREGLRRVEHPGETRWLRSLDEHDPWGSVPQALWCLSIDIDARSSTVGAVDGASALAELYRATPFLFLFSSDRFQRERDRLVPVLVRLVSHCRTFRVRLGRDLLDEPAAAVNRLAEKGG
jgi:hypothetical protein